MAICTGLVIVGVRLVHQELMVDAAGIEPERRVVVETHGGAQLAAHPFPGANREHPVGSVLEPSGLALDADIRCAKPVSIHLGAVGQELFSLFPKTTVGGHREDREVVDRLPIRSLKDVVLGQLGRGDLFVEEKRVVISR